MPSTWELYTAIRAEIPPPVESPLDTRWRRRERRRAAELPPPPAKPRPLLRDEAAELVGISTYQWRYAVDRGLVALRKKLERLRSAPEEALEELETDEIPSGTTEDPVWVYYESCDRWQEVAVLLAEDGWYDEACEIAALATALHLRLTDLMRERYADPTCSHRSDGDESAARPGPAGIPGFFCPEPEGDDRVG